MSFIIRTTSTFLFGLFFMSGVRSSYTLAGKIFNGLIPLRVNTLACILMDIGLIFNTFGYSLYFMGIYNKYR